MITRLVYNSKAFKMINSYGFETSNSEVTFNDINIDFTNGSLADIPYKYQEVKILQADSEDEILNGTVLFTGYIDDIDLSDMKLKKEQRQLTLTLLSPLKMATKRCVTLIGTYDLEEAIERIFEPLLNDGFTLKEMNDISGQITTSYVLETIETCMNDIGYKRSIFWYIDEQKQIYVNSIDYLFGLSATKTINEDIKEQGLIEMQPTIEDVDYANIINFKNVRLIYSERDSYGSSYGGYPILNTTKIVKGGDTVTFNNPIIVDESHLRNYVDEYNSENYTLLNAYCLNIIITTSSGADFFSGYIGFPTNSAGTGISDTFTTNGSITYSDDEEQGTIVLQRDPFYSNLITGFKLNGDSDTEYKITFVYSNTALRYTTMRFMYSNEINNMKGVISDTGQVEKTIDYNNSWTTLIQLIEYARSLMSQNSNEISQVALKYDTNPNLSIGDIVSINAPSFFIEGNYAVSKVKYKYKNELDEEWTITLKQTNLIASYIDIFRPTQSETSESTVDSVLLSEYIEESLNEIHSLVAKGEDGYIISETMAKRLALEDYGVYGDEDYEAIINDYTDYIYTIYIADLRPATVAIYTVNAKTEEVMRIE